jgi:Tfp pilus assembly protein PilW
MDNRHIDREKGVGLIEVMVYVLLSSVVLGSIYRLLESNRSTYNSGESRISAQQNARVGIDEMARELRMTGYFPENFDANLTNNTSIAPVQIATDSALAVYGDLDASGASNVFMFCLDGSVLRRTRGASGVVATYTCSGGDTLAENVTSLRFNYYDINNVSLPATPTPPFQLDSQSPGSVPSFTTLTQRQAVRRVAMVLTVRKDVPPKGSQIYTLTSDARFRNLN